jgi:hypothetical protein
MLLSHIRAFPPSWDGFKALINLPYFLQRRSRATLLFRFSLEGYTGSLDQLTKMSFGPDSLQLLPSPAVVIGTQLYLVGEGSADQILTFDRGLRERYSALNPMFQILDSEVIKGSISLDQTKTLKLDLSFQDPDTILKHAFAALNREPQRGFSVHEEQIDSTVYFFSAKALDPIFGIKGFLGQNFLFTVDVTSRSVGDAIESNQVALQSRNAAIVGWRDLYLLNHEATRRILDLHGETYKELPSSNPLRTHSRLLELIRVCRAGAACTIDVPVAPIPHQIPQINNLIDHTLGVIAGLQPRPPVASAPVPKPVEIVVEPAPAPIVAPSPVVEEEPDAIDDERPISNRPKRFVQPIYSPRPRWQAPTVSTPKPSTPAKPKVTTPKREVLVDKNPFSKALQAALAVNSQIVAKIQEDPMKLAEWVRSKENQLRLQVDFYYQDIKLWLDQYEFALKEQDQGQYEVSMDRLEFSRDRLAQEVIDSEQASQTITLEITFEHLQVPECLIKLRDMYSEVATLKNWDMEVLNENSNNRGLHSVTLRFKGKGASLLAQESGNHRFYRNEGSKSFTSYVQVKIKDVALPPHINGANVRTYDLRKSTIEEMRLLNGETVKDELNQRAQEQALERLLRFGD